MSTPNALPVVGWIREWSFNGEEKGSEITDDEALCRRAVDSSGGVMEPLCKVSDALAAIAAASAVQPKQNQGIFAVDIFRNPMREYLPGKWELAAWPSDAAAAQPPSAAMQPLTDEQIEKVWSAHKANGDCPFPGGVTYANRFNLVRAIEADYGITKAAP